MPPGYHRRNTHLPARSPAGLPAFEQRVRTVLRRFGVHVAYLQAGVPDGFTAAIGLQTPHPAPFIEHRLNAVDQALFRIRGDGWFVALYAAVATGGGGRERRPDGHRRWRRGRSPLPRARGAQWLRVSRPTLSRQLRASPLLPHRLAATCLHAATRAATHPSRRRRDAGWVRGRRDGACPESDAEAEPGSVGTCAVPSPAYPPPVPSLTARISRSGRGGVEAGGRQRWGRRGLARSCPGGWAR